MARKLACVIAFAALLQGAASENQECDDGVCPDKVQVTLLQSGYSIKAAQKLEGPGGEEFATTPRPEDKKPAEFATTPRPEDKKPEEKFEEGLHDHDKSEVPDCARDCFVNGTEPYEPSCEEFKHWTEGCLKDCPKEILMGAGEKFCGGGKDDGNHTHDDHHNDDHHHHHEPSEYEWGYHDGYQHGFFDGYHHQHHEIPHCASDCFEGKDPYEPTCDEFKKWTGGCLMDCDPEKLHHGYKEFCGEGKDGDHHHDDHHGPPECVKDCPHEPASCGEFKEWATTGCLMDCDQAILAKGGEHFCGGGGDHKPDEPHHDVPECARDCPHAPASCGELKEWATTGCLKGCDHATLELAGVHLCGGGSDDGNFEGSGSGHGSGDGHFEGSGSGGGDDHFGGGGSGDGHFEGSGTGSGDGHFEGSGTGSGDGNFEGSGTGSGDGNFEGSGTGSGDGQFEGSGSGALQ